MGIHTHIEANCIDRGKGSEQAGASAWGRVGAGVGCFCGAYGDTLLVEEKGNKGGKRAMRKVLYILIIPVFPIILLCALVAVFVMGLSQAPETDASKRLGIAV